MKITDLEQSILKIRDTYNRRFTPSFPTINKRRSDCFVYVLTGEAEYIFEGKRHIARAGNIVYLAHNSRYSVRVTDENYTFFYVDFYFENPKQVIFENEIYTAKGIAALEKTFEKLYHLWKNGFVADRLMANALLYQIYSEIMKNQSTQYLSAKSKETMEFATNYILTHLDDCNLTAAELSRRCMLSETHFRRLFAILYHTSPIKYITEQRMKRAKELLIGEKLPIAEIATRCGFQNHYYFSAVFKKEIGMTPGSYRKFHQNTL
ncbi:MAG: helix-turn-helix domain-containing protein [Clostridia bacterium]|nr:helix-turn-helix domain-containing protein [Clostridia bacterium]